MGRYCAYCRRYGNANQVHQDLSSGFAEMEICESPHYRRKYVSVPNYRLFTQSQAVSMVDGYLFNRISEIAKRLRKKSDSKKPFGGLQVVVTGDFFQLPPVTKGTFDPHFAFESGAWHDTMDYTVNLVKVFRQKEQGARSSSNTCSKSYIPCRICGRSQFPPPRRPDS